jgi:putative membrane protein
MIEYNTKNWLLIVFNFHKTHALKVLFPSVVFIGIYSTIIVYISTHIQTKLSGTTVVHSLLGIVLGLLLVFRTNTAYDRWWEGRKLWGALVNDSRNLAIKFNVILNDKQDKKLLAEDISFFSVVLKKHLREEINLAQIKNTYENLDNKTHIPNAVASKIFRDTHDLYKSKKISGEELIILDKHIASLTDITGACERIKNTPIPYSYNMHLKKYIFFYIITLPWGLVHDLRYFAVPAVMMVFYAMVGLELIGEEIENPFGYDSDDLPLDKICQNIKNNVYEILEIDN